MHDLQMDSVARHCDVWRRGQCAGQMLFYAIARQSVRLALSRIEISIDGLRGKQSGRKMLTDQQADNVIGTVGPIANELAGYELWCTRCGKCTRVAGIVDLLLAHTSALGRFLSPCCAGVVAIVSEVDDDLIGRLIGAFMIDSGIETDFPYGFVVAPSDDGTSGGLYFPCALDSRAGVIDRLRKGDAPAGPLVIASANPRSIIKHLRQVGLLPEKSIA